MLPKLNVFDRYTRNGVKYFGIFEVHWALSYKSV